MLAQRLDQTGFFFVLDEPARILVADDDPILREFACVHLATPDVTLDTAGGRLFSIALMLIGISLFFTIAQKAFAPQKRIERCSDCGTDRHDLDARHCKSCGARLTEPAQAGG